MIYLDSIQAFLSQIAWPFAIAFGWLVGEVGSRWLKLPRISCYGLAGFVLASGQLGVLPPPGSGGPASVAADLALGLVLFELGYRINLRWLKNNRWLAATSLVESFATFFAVLATARWFALDWLSAMLIASISMSTSPAAVLRVTNELRSSGQVTERALHLSAFNCIFAVIVFKVVVGYGVLSGAGGVLKALSSSVLVVLISAMLGFVFGVIMPELLRRFAPADRSASLAFVVGIFVLTALTHLLNLSPILATLSFGIVARHRRVVLAAAERNFGVLGDALAVVLFVFVASMLDWRQVLLGLPLALALIFVRLMAKTGAVVLLARPSGLSWSKALNTGFALMPLSAFAILLMEQTRYVGVAAIEGLPVLAAIVLLLDLFGPLATRSALIRAGEAEVEKESGRAGKL